MSIETSKSLFKSLNAEMDQLRAERGDPSISTKRYVELCKEIEQKQSELESSQPPFLLEVRRAVMNKSKVSAETLKLLLDRMDSLEQSVQEQAEPEPTSENASVREGASAVTDEEAENNRIFFSRYIGDGDTTDRVVRALTVFFKYGQIDGSHHKAWAIDQAVRELTGDRYEDLIDHYQFGLTDLEMLAKYKILAAGEYYDGDFTDEEIAEFEEVYSEWDSGIAG